MSFVIEERNNPSQTKTHFLSIIISSAAEALANFTKKCLDNQPWGVLYWPHSGLVVQLQSKNYWHQGFRVSSGKRVANGNKVILGVEGKTNVGKSYWNTSNPDFDHKTVLINSLTLLPDIRKLKEHNGSSSNMFFDSIFFFASLLFTSIILRHIQ